MRSWSPIVNKNTSPLHEGGPIRKGINVLSNRKMERLFARWWAMIALSGNTPIRQLTELYRALRLYVNCFQPSMKLLSKERDGKKVRYVYDPAKTPLQRLLLSGVLPAQKQQELTEVAQALDPIRLLEPTRAVATGCLPLCCRLLSFDFTHPFCIPIRVFSVERLYKRESILTRGVLPIQQQDLRPCTESRSGENGCWAGGAPTRTPLQGSGSRSCPGWWPILNGAAATSSGSCSTAPRTLSTITNPYPPARDAENTSLPAWKRLEEQWQEEVIRGPLPSPISAEMLLQHILTCCQLSKASGLDFGEAMQFSLKLIHRHRAGGYDYAPCLCASPLLAMLPFPGMFPS